MGSGRSFCGNIWNSIAIAAAIRLFARELSASPRVKQPEGFIGLPYYGTAPPQRFRNHLMNLTSSHPRPRVRALRPLLTAIALLAPLAARAETLWGTTNVNRLVSFDSAAPGTLTTNVAITGLTSGYSVFGIDFRPSNGLLYALAVNFSAGQLEQLYTLNLGTGAATLVGSLGIDFSSNFIGMSFDPVADQIRITEYDNANGQIRVNPNTGASLGADTALVYAAGDVNTGNVSTMDGLAYSSPVLGKTTAYGLAWGGTASTNFLVRIGDVGGTPAGAAGGQVHTIGSLGVDSPNTWSFDISPTSGTAYAVDAGSLTNILYSVNLVTGAATSLGTVGATGTFGFAVAPAPTPEPGSVLLLTLGAGLLAARRRRDARAQLPTPN